MKTKKTKKAKVHMVDATEIAEEITKELTAEFRLLIQGFVNKYTDEDSYPEEYHSLVSWGVIPIYDILDNEAPSFLNIVWNAIDNALNEEQEEDEYLAA